MLQSFIRRFFRMAIPACLLFGSWPSIAGASPIPNTTSNPTSADPRVDAAARTAATNSSCSAAMPFYWEVGDRNGKLAFGTAGGSSPTATTQMLVDSASKWIFGAYVVQLRNGQLTKDDIAALTMRAGYTHTAYDIFARSSCILPIRILQDAQTVHQCFTASNRVGGHNDDYNSRAVNKFYYNGGHLQWLADKKLKLGSKNNASLKTAIAKQVGTDFSFTYDSPQVADGVKTTAKDYAIFLRKILDRQLLIYDFLGKHSICTNPRSCSDAIYRPIESDLNYHYSVGHFVEDDTSQDGAFASPGWRGFYPWIDVTKTYYGIVARDIDASDGYGVTDSVYCGSAIRQAWATGTVQ